MALIQPNIQDAPTFDAQAVRDEVDLYASSALGGATGVISGCLCSPGGGMSVNVASGVVWSNGVAYIVPSTNVAVTAHSTGDRRDTVCYTAGVGLQVIAGVDCGVNGWNKSLLTNPPVKAMGPASGSTVNQVPYGSVTLAEVYVSGSTSTVAAGNLVDKTAILNPAPLPPLGAAVMVTMSWGTNTATANGSHDNVLERIAGRCGIQNILNLAVGGSALTSWASLEGPFGGFAGALHMMMPPSSGVLASASFSPLAQGVQGYVSGPPLFVLHAINDWSYSAQAAITGGTSAVGAKWQALMNNAYNQALTAAISRHTATVVFGSYSSPVTLANNGGFFGAWSWDPTVLFSTGTGLTAWANQNNWNSTFPANTGPVAKATSASPGANGNMFTIQIPNNYTGGTICINLVGCPTGLAALSQNITSGTTSIVSAAPPTSGQFPCFLAGAQLIQIDAEQMFCSGVAANTPATGQYTFTVTARGANGTVAAAHNYGAAIFTPQTGNVTWSGSASCVAGMANTYFTGVAAPSYATGVFAQPNNQHIPIPVRVTVLPTDAGKTIVGTVQGLSTTTDSTSKCIYDSWWIESPNPSPAVIANLPRFPCGAGSNAYTYSTFAQAVSMNAQMQSTVSQFGSWCQVADLDAAWNPRNAVLAGSVPQAVHSATVSGTQNCNTASLLVSATANYTSSGSVTFYDSANYYNVVTYTSTDATHFIGCTGGRVSAGDGTAAQVSSGSVVTQATSISFTLNNAANPPVVGQRWVVGTAAPYMFTETTTLTFGNSSGASLAVSAGMPNASAGTVITVNDGGAHTQTFPLSAPYSGGGTATITAASVTLNSGSGYACTVASFPEDLLLISQTSLVGTAFTGVFGRAYNAASSMATNVAHFGGDPAAPADWFFTDNVHPSAYGAAKIADLVYASFQAASFNSLSLSLTASAAVPVSNNKSPSGTRLVDLGWWIPPLANATCTPTTGGGTIYAYPFDVEAPGMLEVVSVLVLMSATGAGSRQRVGIYYPDMSGANPGSLMIDFGAISTDTGQVAPQAIVGMGELLYPGRYFVAIVPNQAGTSAAMRAIGPGVAGALAQEYPPMSSAQTGYPALANAGPVYARSTTTGGPWTGALPTTWTAAINATADVTTQSTVPAVCLQFRTHQWN